VKIRVIGRIGFNDAWQQMRAFTDTRTNDTEDELWIVEHEPVFTQGVAGKPEHLLINPSNIPVIKTDRGGQITYHGPGQAMVYILFDLRRSGCGVRELVVRIENAVIASLRGYGVAAYGKRDAPGVYVHRSLEPLSRSAGEGWGEGDGMQNQLRINPPSQIPEDLKTFAREMRVNVTHAETLMWQLVRNRQIVGAKFRRQHPIGRYILDFYCEDLQLAIELDGGQHADQVPYDAKRTAWLVERGIRVLRFWNNDVLNNTEGVFDVVYRTLSTPQSPLPQPSPALRERASQHATPTPISAPAREAKIASLGLKVRNGCSYHGVALNVNMDLTPFSFINPCGYEGLAVTHLHDFGVNDPANDVAMRLARELELQLALPPAPKA
jgi:lipoate-protein ligase B/very-short-patch-repair endonuclease